MTLRLLDLFCCAGGASMGYHRAGFEVIGVDIKDQPNYPFEFHQADVAKAEFWATFKGPFDVIHASPPCQNWTAYRRKGHGVGDGYPDLINDVRTMLEMSGTVWLIENIPATPLRNPVQLCGSSFGLDIRRHRLFESNAPLVAPPCNHVWQTPRFPPATNRMNLRCTVEVGAYRCAGLSPKAMGIDWMTNEELSEAIPPAYTEFLGRQVHAYLRARQEAA